MAKEQLIVEVVAEAKQAIRGLKEYTSEVKKSADRMGKLTKVLKSYWGEALAAYAAVRKLIKIGKDLTQAFIKQEEAVARMDSALRATGIYTPTVSANIQELARQLQATTKFGDEMTLQASALLQSLAGLSEKGLMEIIPLVQDFATGMGLDLNTAASLVGKTLGSTTNALSRYGIVIDMTQGKAGKMAELQEQINAKFKDSAEILGTTFGGQVQRLNNLFGDMKEVLGGILAEQAEPFIQWIIDFLQNSENIEIVARIWKGFFKAFGVGLAINIAEIKSFILGLKWMGMVLNATSKIMAISMDPRRWGKGGMKAALRELTVLVKDSTMDVIDSWRNAAEKVEDYINEVFVESAIPTIKTFGDKYKLDVNKPLEETTAIVTDLLTVYKNYHRMRMTEIEETIPDLVTQYKNLHRARMIDIAAAEEEIQTTKDLVNTFGVFNEAAYDMGVGLYMDVEQPAERATDQFREMYGIMSILNNVGLRALADGMRLFASIMKKDVIGAINAAISLIKKVIDLFRNVDEEARKRVEKWLGLMEEIKGQVAAVIEDAWKTFLAVFSDTGSMKEAMDAMEKTLTEGMKEAILKAIMNQAAAIIAAKYLSDIIARIVSAIGRGEPLGDMLGELQEFMNRAMDDIGRVAEVLGGLVIPSFQHGGQFITGGPQLMRVGDNPSGRERVTVEPLDSGGGMIPSTINLVLDGRVLSSWIYKKGKRGQVLFPSKSVV